MNQEQEFQRLAEISNGSSKPTLLAIMALIDKSQPQDPPRYVEVVYRLAILMSGGKEPPLIRVPEEVKTLDELEAFDRNQFRLGNPIFRRCLIERKWNSDPTDCNLVYAFDIGEGFLGRAYAIAGGSR